jgi:hypothetical protein
MQSNKKETTFDDYLKEQLKDPEFRKEWENCVTCDHFGKCEGCKKGDKLLRIVSAILHTIEFALIIYLLMR